MARSFVGPSRALLATLLCSSSVWAAKVVVVLNPWRADPALSSSTPQIFGVPNSWNGDAVAANQFRRLSGDYWSYTFSSSTPGDFRLLNRGNNGWAEYGASGSGSTSFNINTLLATSDTVWIIPGATLATTPTIQTTPPAPPASATLMIQNPWEATSPGAAPGVQVGSAAWSSATAVAGQPGWYSISAGFTGSLVVGIRNSGSTSWIGSTGLSSSPAILTLDTAYAKNDTIWIATSPGLRILSTRPTAQGTGILYVFNPWDGTFPLARPVAFLDGSTVGIPMDPSPDHCGWFQLAVSSPRQLLIRNSGTGVAFGVAGAASTGLIPLLTSDTQWVATSTGKAVVTKSRPVGEPTGTCSRALLATTVHDFELDAAGFNKIYTDLTRGIVQDTLDADRKPVLKTDTASATGIADWFRDVPGLNASACRDLVLTLDTTTGVYRMNSPEFFPIDDFDKLGDGSANPYNNLLGASSLAHNYSFCLESHGEFDYRPGQTLEFSGDDDLWYYVDGRLRSDLGGVHIPMSDAISLDTMGLTAGRTYPWDFFFCERMPGGSSLKITTSMNLRTSARFTASDTVLSSSKAMRIWSTNTVGQGCAARTVRTTARGEVSLRGGALKAPIALPVGVNFGGIRVFDSSWQVSLDTARLSGLDAGTYVLKIRSAADTSRYREIVFVVAPSTPPPPTEHPYVPGTRCDLLSGPVLDTTKCMDIGSLDGKTLRVPAATTRISSKGFVLCGTKGQAPEGTDIVYIIDQSGSMQSRYVLPQGKDTSSYYECSGISSSQAINFHGVKSNLIGKTDSASAARNCKLAGDVYQQRANTVKEAITLQAELSPTSQAAWISFGSTYSSSELVDLSDPAATARLLGEIRVDSLSGTYYEDPLGWARILLQGGNRSDGTDSRPGSRNRPKAIIVISDGEPSDQGSYLSALAKGAYVTGPDDEAWIATGDSAPPIYGFFLSQRSGNALQTLANATHGAFYQIPPSDPDSLRRVMTRLLGTIVASKRPDSLRITNLTNGQVSLGAAGAAEGGGFRVSLDSLVGLVPGPNILELRSVLTGDRDSVVNARWTVVVSDSAPEFTPLGTDSVLMASCTAPSRLSLKAASDTSRAYALETDSLLRLSLNVAYDGQLRFPIGFSTAFSADSGAKELSLTAAPATARAAASGQLVWRLQVPSVRGDAVVGTGFGWDTAIAIFHTPRDLRDTATAKLPVRHAWPVSIRISPDTAGGVAGTLTVSVHDTNTTADAVVASVFHRLGDSLSLVLRRIGPADFAATFGFRQSSAVVRGDTLLQTGPARLLAFDSVMASYSGAARDTALLRRPDPSFMFLGADGTPSESMEAIELDIGETATLRIASVLGGSVVARADSATVILPDWLEALDASGRSPIGGVRLAAGTATLTVRGIRPGSNGAIRFEGVELADTLVGSPISVLPYRIVFVDAAGNALTTNALERDVLSRDTMRFQLHGRKGICTACSGTALLAASAPSILLQGPGATKTDSVTFVQGAGWFLLQGSAPVRQARVAVAAPAFQAIDSLYPVTYHPYRLLFADSTGNALDSRSIDRQVRTTETVRVLVHGMNGLCVACNGTLSVTVSDPSLSWTDSSGAQAAPLVRSGQAWLKIRSDLPLEAASVGLALDSLFVASTIAPVRFSAPAPDSVVYEDRDGDGALDHAAVFFRIPWNPSNRFAFRWPEQSSPLDTQDATYSVTSDSLRLDVAFAGPQAPGRTGWTGSVSIAAGWRWSEAWLESPFAAIERIAPIPRRARILRGSGFDTLVVKASEPILADAVRGGADLVRSTIPGAPSLATGRVRWNASDSTLRLAYPSDSIDAIVRPLDSVRFAPQADLADLGGSRPGPIAPAVVVEGIDRAPSSARVRDTDADGRADQVELRFATAPRVADLFRFRWPDTAGILQERLASTPARTDSVGRILTFQVAPFAYGATSCSMPGCSGLGSMENTRWGDTLRLAFDEIDAVDPVILKARLRFGNPLGTLDTVRAILSEPVEAFDGAGWLRWGRPSRDSLGDSVPRISGRHPDPRILEILVDSSFLGTSDDSLRIQARPAGGVSDQAGNAPGRLAHWTRLELGPIPLRLEAGPWPSMARNTGWEVPRGESPISVYVRSSPTAPWKELDGTREPGPISHYVGISLRTNKDIDGGTLYLYDNLGVAVAKLDLAELAEAVRQGRVVRTLRGGYEAWIAWNGVTSTGQFAPTGVYIGRLVVWKRIDGQLSMVHKVFKLGWQMPTIHNWTAEDEPIW